MTPEMRWTHLLSDSFGVRVATSEATAITLAAICRSCSAFSVMYWIMVGGYIMLIVLPPAPAGEKFTAGLAAPRCASSCSSSKARHTDQW